MQAELFADNSNTPEGFLYRADFILPEEERELVAAIGALSFGEVKMHGVLAKRRTAQLLHVPFEG